MNKDKIILDLCGGTGSWSRPYKEAGYEVHIITLPELSVADWWITHDTLRFRKQVWAKDGGEYLDIPLDKLYGVLAAPPCTMFSVARSDTTAKLPRDLVGGMATVKNCMRIVHKVQERKYLAFWALENPRGYLRKFLGKPPYTFEQWQFDYKSNHKKPTDIWGNFNIPKQTVKSKPTNSSEFYEKNWGNPKAPKEYQHLKLDRAAIRAITNDGFARAFYEVNK